MKKTTTICELLALLANIRLAHWQADSKTNEHATLGTLYADLDELVDTYAELILGKNGNRDIEALNIELVSKANLAELLNEGLVIVDKARTDAVQGKDDDILNILADITSTLYKAKYLLQL